MAKTKSARRIEVLGRIHTLHSQVEDIIDDLHELWVEGAIDDENCAGIWSTEDAAENLDSALDQLTENYHDHWNRYSA